MRKEQLVSALVKAAKGGAAKGGAAKAAPARRSTTAGKTATAKASAAKTTKTRAAAKTRASSKSSAKSAASKGTKKGSTARSRTTSRAGAARNGTASKSAASKTPARPTAAMRRLQREHVRREEMKDLSKASNGKATTLKDRVVLMVRDPYWLHACWELSRQSVMRAQAAMAEHWHTARPVLRLMESEIGNTTNIAQRPVRDIEIHGGVKNWYIDVPNPPNSYSVDVGYLSATGKFFSIARSNTVSTPRPGSADAVDDNWADVAANCERVYAMSGGYAEEGNAGELQEMFEERLRRPMGSPMVTRYGVGADRTLGKSNDFHFEVDAEMIIFGKTKPTAYVTLMGAPVKLQADGSFAVRLEMPDRRQVLPIVAHSVDGVEQRTIVLAVDRNTKSMEPMIRDGSD